MDDKLVEIMLADIKELKSDVKSLLQFKWQSMGGTIVASAIIGVVVQIAIAVYSKH